MKFLNPLQINDWSIWQFLTIIFSIQIALWGLYGLSFLNISVPFIRQIISFIYLIFVPGILILRCLKLHKLGTIEATLLTIGLSLAVIMLIGFSTNFLYSLIKISHPLSIFPLLINFTFFITLMCILSYILDRDYCDPELIDISDVLSNPALLLYLIPFFAILGTYLMNFYNSNQVLLCLIIYIAFIVISIGFNKIIPSRMYPFAIWLIALALVYHTALITSYVWGWDINLELFLSKIVIQNNFWDPSLYSSTNAMLSVIILVPVFSVLGNIDPVWVLKVYYPFFISLMVLGLYKIYEVQSNERIAFFSCFFFISFFGFFTELFQLARQAIAELFLILLLLVLMNSRLEQSKKIALLIIFAIAIPLSHYGLSIIFIIMLLLGFFYLSVIPHEKIVKRSTSFLSKIRGLKQPIFDFGFKKYQFDDEFKLQFIFLITIFTITWYIYIANNGPIDSVVQIGTKIYDNLFEQFFKTESIQGLDLIIKEASSPLHSVWKYLQLLSQFFISVGLFSLFFFKDQRQQFRRQFIALSLVGFIMLIFCMVIPFFASSLNTSRIYQITLIFLSPFFVIGVLFILRVINYVIKFINMNISIKNSFIILSIFLTVILVFNTGFLFEIVKDKPVSIAFNNTLHYPRFSQREVTGATWLYSVKDDNVIVSDVFSSLLIKGLNSRTKDYYGSVDEQPLPDRYELNNLQADQLNNLQKLKKQRNTIYENGIISVNKII